MEMDAQRGESVSAFPYLKVEARDYRDLGHAIGSTFSERIREAMQRRADWIKTLRDFAIARPKTRFHGFVNSIAEHFPWILEELHGLAEGADVSFEDLMLVNLNPELAALMKEASEEPGCTTLTLCDEHRIWIAHNEDGNCNYRDLMYVLEVTPPSGVRFFAVSYPGILPGNGPAINYRGITHNVNFIGARECRPGVPRYAIDRAILESKDLAHALSIATHPARAYSEHHLIGSARDHKLLSVETVPGRYQVHELRGLYGHANHLILPAMRDIPQLDGTKISSQPRQDAADRGISTLDPQSVAQTNLMAILACHEGRPAVCRHPGDQPPGCTLATSFFELPECRIRIYRNNPCEGRFRDYDFLP